MKQNEAIKLMVGSAVIQYLSTVPSATKSEILEGAIAYYRFESDINSPENDRTRIRCQIGTELKLFVAARYVRETKNGFQLIRKIPDSLPDDEPHESWLRDLKETYPPAEMLPLIQRHSGIATDGKGQIELYYFLPDGLPVSLNRVYLESPRKRKAPQPEKQEAVKKGSKKKAVAKVPVRTLQKNEAPAPEDKLPAPQPAVKKPKQTLKRVTTRTEKKPAAPDPTVSSHLSEDEQLQEAYLQKLCQKGGAFFEQFVAGLLIKQFLACGTDVLDYSIVGGTADGGIDVIFNTVDEMGFRDRVMVQAKCHIRATVTEKTIRDFYGSMKMQDGTRGIFITTTSFTTSAQALLNTLGSCIGIDGATLYKMAKDLSYGVHSGKSKCFLDPAIFGK